MFDFILQLAEILRPQRNREDEIELLKMRIEELEKYQKFNINCTHALIERVERMDRKNADYYLK